MPNIIKWAEQKLRGKPKVAVVRQKIQDPREKKVPTVPLVPPKTITKILSRKEELRKIMEEM